MFSNPQGVTRWWTEGRELKQMEKIMPKQLISPILISSRSRFFDNLPQLSLSQVEAFHGNDSSTFGACVLSWLMHSAKLPQSFCATPSLLLRVASIRRSITPLGDLPVRDSNLRA